MLTIFGESEARASEIVALAADQVGLSPDEGNYIAQPTPLSENVFDVSEIAMITSQATAVHDMMHCAALWLQNVNVSGVPAPPPEGYPHLDRPLCVGAIQVPFTGCFAKHVGHLTSSCSGLQPGGGET
jgi:hypothetical protein